MKTYIALLKGINVGGHKKVPMIDLRNLLEKEGFQNVQTYIQSGNVILQTSESNKLEIEEYISKAIQSHFGFEVSVLVKTRTELLNIFEKSPFNEEKKKASYFMMLHDEPKAEVVREASQKVYEGEEYHIINDCIYYFHDKGLGKAKFNVNFFERKFQTFATARNYNTMLKLLSLSED
ncbi:DUF1697 domain-containing protein [Hanstruepera ponticola]|uniref:DUF1697 domain-containing protein n=1 Tax=Hanstruepera ponticola TaxID=2042995 RepID=UPI000CF04841|nr:DUF1697 domain-containing protein [Hanstruepera ponticola]